MTPYLLIGLVALVTTFICTPLVRYAALRLRLIDNPEDRKVHARATPTMGGIAIFIGLLVAGAVAALMPEFQEVFTDSADVLGIAAGALVIFALGVVDDIRPLPAAVKLAGQVFASGILFLSGIRMQFILLPGSETISLSEDVSVLVTIFWLVAMINAVNLVDGLDGLAAGIVAIAASSFFVYTFQLASREGLGDAPSAPLIAIMIVGVTLGFLRYNFYPASIFMGDSGSMLLGLVLGAATIVGVGQSQLSDTASEVFLAYAPLLIPALVVALPLLDAILAVVRRARRRRSIFHADKEHLHHRLMDMGHGHRQAVIVMYLWSGLAAGAALAFTFLPTSSLVFALPIAVGAIVLYTLFPLLTKVIQERLRL
jgi:UDP-GlcNAc:undecaprenyl-phosphate GlcNAc-1-phosphate transferase